MAVKSRLGLSTSLNTLESMPKLVRDTLGVSLNGPRRMGASLAGSDRLCAAAADTVSMNVRSVAALAMRMVGVASPFQLQCGVHFTGRLAISRCAIAVLPWLPTRDVNERRERRRSAAGDDALL